MSRDQRPAAHRALVGNAADQDQVTTAKRKERDANEIASDNRRAVLSTYEGRQFWWDLMGECGIFASTVTHTGTGALDPLAMAVNEGQRNAGLRLMQHALRDAPDLYLQMQSESIQREKKANA